MKIRTNDPIVQNDVPETNAQNDIFETRLKLITKEYDTLVNHRNTPQASSNGVFQRYHHPVLTAGHIPLHWRYDLNPATNPYCMERIGVNAAFNAGAMKFNGKYILMVRVEGADRKSFFAVAESDHGIDGFRFTGKPVVLPQTSDPDVNVYDMRLTYHEDGFIYGIFCTERKDRSNPNDISAATAHAGIARTKDLVNWERLPDLVSNSGQQRNVVMHPEFVNGKYALFTRPQDGFIEVGSGGGIGLGFVSDMRNPVVNEEKIIHAKQYHTIYEIKNGLGPAPIKTREGWLHLAHGVRNTAAGLRYVLYLFMTELHDLSRIKYLPGGYFMAPHDEERVGDVSNVLFSNGWIADEDGTVYIYYASSDTRMHVATSSIGQLIDYAKNTPPDQLHSHLSVKTIHHLIDKNKPFLK